MGVASRADRGRGREQQAVTDTMSGAVGANVAQYCRDQARIAELLKNTRITDEARATAGWHEKQCQAALSGKLNRQRQAEEIKEELEMAKRAHLLRRQASMRVLYESERQSYEEELNRLGLTIDTSR